MLNKNETKTTEVLNSIKMGIQKNSMFIFLIGITLIFQLLTDGILLMPLNITNIILQNSYILILAIGMLLVIILGHIDLSVGSVTAFVGAIAAILMIKKDLNPYVSIIVCLLVGILIGAFQGFWIAYVKVPSFIATLAGMLIFRGLTIVVLDGKSIGPFPRVFQLISSGFIPSFGSAGGGNLTTILIGVIFIISYMIFKIINRRKKLSLGYPLTNSKLYYGKIVIFLLVISYFIYTFADYEGIPNVLVILAFLVGIYQFVTQKTTFGRSTYAIGGNIRASALSGIKTKWVTFLVFVNMGLMSAIAGIVFSARLNAATATAGNGFELDAIAACFIGGASATGGVGTVLGAIIGGLVMGVLNNGMSIMGVGVDWQQTIKGLVLLLVVALDVYNKKKDN